MKKATEQIKQKAWEMGADLVGIAPVDRWEKAPEMLQPQAHLPGAKSVVVMGIHHPDASVEWGGLPGSNYAGPFQIGMIPKLDTMSRRLARYIDNLGEKAIPYPCTGFWRHRPYKSITSTNTASFSHRHAAVAAGLGEFGWNNLFLSRNYGPRQRLISVITTADLDSDQLYTGDKLCDRCGMCSSHCPGKNYEEQHLLFPGFDRVEIDGMVWEYAKLNRWRCLWGEQFAFDMDKLASWDVKGEEELYKAAGADVLRLGGEFGNCLRFCMSKPIRKWEKTYSAAPLREKLKKEINIDELVGMLREIGRQNGADNFNIRPLSSFPDSCMRLSQGYPLHEMRKNFTWVVSFGRKIPSFPVGSNLSIDCSIYIRAAGKVRLSICAYESAALIDGLGWEAMQDWMSLGETAFASSEQKSMIKECDMDGFEENSLSREERYKPAADKASGVQREQQSMTAGAQNQKNAPIIEPGMISCSVICEVPLRYVSEDINLFTDMKECKIASLPFLEHVDRIAVIKINKLPKGKGLADVSKLLPGANSLIVLQMAIPMHIAELANRQKAECATSYSYLQYQTLRELLWAAHDLSGWLYEKGHDALPFADLSTTSFRTLAPYWEFSWTKLGHPDPRANAPLAAAAGLGEIGMSGLLLSPGFGPHHKFVFVATTADISETAPFFSGKICLSCGRCADACPMKALDNSGSEILPGGAKTFPRNEDKCQWARSLGMCMEEGPGTIGWKTPDTKLIEPLTIEAVKKALAAKDPLQRLGYLYPCQIDTIVEKCSQDCPAK
ncbi:MAG: hypothetical protein A2096_05055 [Spirochaetes bacterium GWF1_41_5]|nr:MAG: hypothetical protein A2096_05055 [Spirochaetes bacterium GWF1_41_5]HBE03086.1 hypothetical protein [Spirochaetia bacterium]